MNKNKMDYTSPTCETLVVRFEGVICQSTLNVLIWGDTNEAGSSFSEDALHTYNY